MTSRNRRGIPPILFIAIMLAACGTATPTPTTPSSSTPTTSATPTVPPPGSATPAVTAVLSTASSAPLVAGRTALPTGTPEMTAGARSDGWVLDRIEASESGGRVSLTVRFEPLPGQVGGPEADAWFAQDDSTYTIAIHGVRGSNLVLPPSTMMPLTAPPFRGYYALPVRDDTIFALVVVAARPSAAWSLTASDGPGILRLTLNG